MNVAIPLGLALCLFGFPESCLRVGEFSLELLVVPQTHGASSQAQEGYATDQQKRCNRRSASCPVPDMLPSGHRPSLDRLAFEKAAQVFAEGAGTLVTTARLL